MAVRAQTSSPEVALGRLRPQLQDAWQGHPFTAQRPFPMLRLVEGSAEATCNGPFGAAAPLLQVCAGGRELWLDRQQLASLQEIYGEGAMAFALAYGLGLTLVPPQPPGAPQPPATAGLQAACYAGTLLGSLPPASRQQALKGILEAAAEAYGSAAADQLGTGPQRAYALASGIGATGLPCSAAAMARLASGALNDQAAAWLRARGPGVGFDLLCRQPPACPRRLGI